MAEAAVLKGVWSKRRLASDELERGRSSFEIAHGSSRSNE